MQTNSAAGFARVTVVTCQKTAIDDVIAVLLDDCEFEADGATCVNAAGWQAKLDRNKLEKELNVQ